MSIKYKYSVCLKKGNKEAGNRLNFFANGQYLNYREMNAGAFYNDVKVGKRQIFSLSHNQSEEGKATNLIALFLERLQKKKNKLRIAQTSEYLRQTLLNMNRGVRENLGGNDAAALSMLYINNGNAYAACVGRDSIYKYYQDDNRLEKLENPISGQCLLGAQPMPETPELKPFVTSMGRVVPKRNYLLVSKSIENALTPEEIAETLKNEPGKAAELLVEKASQKQPEKDMAAIYVRPKKRIFWLVLLCIAVLAVCLFMAKDMLFCSDQQVAPADEVQEVMAPANPDDTVPQETAKLTDIETELRGITSEVESLGTGCKATYYVKNLETGEELMYGAESKMYSASVIKLFIMAEVYRQVNDGTIQMTSEVKNHLRQMITVSSNESANALTELVGGGDLKKGTEAVTKNAKNLGCSATAHNNDLQNNRTVEIPQDQWNATSAKDAAKIMEMIYKGELVSKAYSKEMLELLKVRKTVEVQKTKIYKGVPSNVTVANKTGETSKIQNDVGIVYTEKGNFLISVMTYDPTCSNERTRNAIAKMTKVVYNHIMK